MVILVRLIVLIVATLVGWNLGGLIGALLAGLLYAAGANAQPTWDIAGYVFLLGLR